MSVTSRWCRSLFCIHPLVAIIIMQLEFCRRHWDATDLEPLFLNLFQEKGMITKQTEEFFSRLDCHQVSVEVVEFQKEKLLCRLSFLFQESKQKNIWLRNFVEKCINKDSLTNIRTFSNRIQLFKKKQKDRFAVDFIISREYELEQTKSNHSTQFANERFVVARIYNGEICDAAMRMI